MSGDDRGNPPDGSNKDKKRFRVVKQGDSARPSSQQIHQLFMASEHIQWTPFAKSMGWNPETSRASLPIKEWITSKQEIIAREQAETVAEAVFNHKSRWHSDVLKTLKEYPEANDAMLGVLKKRLNDIIGTINKDNEGKVIAAQSGGFYEPQFDKIKNSELSQLASAIKTCTESKHRSLMIHDWSFKVAEQFTDPKRFESFEDKLSDTEWTVEVIGGENLTSKQMEDFLGRWYDSPVSRPSNLLDEVDEAVEEAENSET